MSDEFTVHSGALKIRIHCIQDDIDDDDRDTLRIVIEVTNEGAQTVSGIVSRMRTMEGGKAEPHESFFLLIHSILIRLPAGLDAVRKVNEDVYVVQGVN